MLSKSVLQGVSSMIPLRKFLFIVAAFALIAGCQIAAQADPLVLSLQNNSFTITPGGSVTIIASAFNSGAINTNPDIIEGIGDTVFTGFWHVDLAPFFTNFDFESVASGDTLGPLALITFMDPGNGPGSYNGQVTLFYFSDGNPGILRGNDAQFTITIAAAPIPEPTTMLLLGAGLAGIAAKLKTRRKQ